MGGSFFAQCFVVLSFFSLVRKLHDLNGRTGQFSSKFRTNDKVCS